MNKIKTIFVSSLFLTSTFTFAQDNKELESFGFYAMPIVLSGYLKAAINTCKFDKSMNLEIHETIEATLDSVALYTNENLKKIKSVANKDQKEFVAAVKKEGCDPRENTLYVVRLQDYLFSMINESLRRNLMEHRSNLKNLNTQFLYDNKIVSKKVPSYKVHKVNSEEFYITAKIPNYLCLYKRGFVHNNNMPSNMPEDEKKELIRSVELCEARVF